MEESTSLEEAVVLHNPRFERDTPDIARVRADYEARKAAQDALDFDDLLVFLGRLLSKNAEARKQIAGRCTQLATQAMSDIQSTCCDDAASCTSGAPTVCSASCAIVFLPYQAQCAATVWGNQPTFAASMSTFRETCLHG